MSCVQIGFLPIKYYKIKRYMETQYDIGLRSKALRHKCEQKGLKKSRLRMKLQWKAAK